MKKYAGLALSAVFLSGIIISDTINSLYALGLLAISYPAFRASEPCRQA